MEPRQKHEGLICRDTCLQYVMDTFGFARTPFHMAHSDFAIRVAELSEELFLSRYGGCVDVLSDEKRRLADVIWAAAILSHTELYSHATYEDIARISNSEVAGYLYVVNPENKLGPAQRIRRYLTTLVCGSALAKLIVFSRVAVNIDTLGADTTNTDSHLQWWLVNVLEQIKRVGDWSASTANMWENCSGIVKTWSSVRQSIWPPVKKKVSWHMDTKDMQNHLDNLVWED